MFRRVRLPPLVKRRMTAALRRRVPIGDEKFVHVCMSVPSVSQCCMIRRELVPVQKVVHHSRNDGRTLAREPVPSFSYVLVVLIAGSVPSCATCPHNTGCLCVLGRKRLRDIPSPTLFSRPFANTCWIFKKKYKYASSSAVDLPPSNVTFANILRPGI